MFNFDFYNPTRIVFGKDRFACIGEQILSDAKVLLTYGSGSAKRNGVFDKVKNALGDRKVVEFGGIEPNPRYETLSRAVKMVQEEQIDFIIAIGGGSVIDGTKFISIASQYEGDSTELLKCGFAPMPVHTALPFGVVLTLPATGSEMNCAAVISYEHAKYVISNELLFPQFSIVDPTITFTLPQKQVANGVVDAFVHVTEQYLTYPVEGKVQDRLAEGLLETLIEIGTTSVNEAENYNARANHVWSATLALNGLIGAGVPQDWATHFIGHELTSLFGMDHGQTLAVILPSLLEVRREQKRAKLLQYAERVWHIENSNDEEKIDLAIAKTREFFESLGVKTRLSAYGVEADKVPVILEQLKAHGMTAISETGDLTLDVSQRILENAI